MRQWKRYGLTGQEEGVPVSYIQRKTGSAQRLYTARSGHKQTAGAAALLRSAQFVVMVGERANEQQ